MLELKTITGDTIMTVVDSLKNTQFRDKAFHRADFSKMNLSELYFINCNLRGAFFDNCILENSSLKDCNLITCSFKKASLQSCNFSKSIAISCDFSDSLLINANLEDVDIKYSVFNGADLRGANMLCKNIESADFTGAIYDEKTKFPKNFPIEKLIKYQA